MIRTTRPHPIAVRLVALFIVCLGLTSILAIGAVLALPSPRTYHVRVVNGVLLSGIAEGDYSAGAHVELHARPAHLSEEFVHWTFAPDGLTIHGVRGVSGTSVTIAMPDEPVIATAHFQPKPPRTE